MREPDAAGAAAVAGASGTLRTELIRALLLRDVAGLRALQARCRPADLWFTEPMSVYHAAALSDCHEAIPLLLAVGAPISCSHTAHPSPDYAAAFSSVVERPRQGCIAALANNGSALAAAAILGHVGSTAALLAAGAGVDVGTSWYTPLESAAVNVGEWAPRDAEAMMRLLLEGGADPTRLRLEEALEPCCAAEGGAPGRLLLAALRRRSEAGLLGWPLETVEASEALFNGIGLADVADSLPHFAELAEETRFMMCNLDVAALAYALLEAAAEKGSSRVLQLAVHGGAGPGGAAWLEPPPPPGSEAARQFLAGPYRSLGPDLLPIAAENGRGEAVRLLLRDGQPVPAAALCGAVRGDSLDVLEAPLEAGHPEVPTSAGALTWHGTVELPGARYTCPILTALQARIELVGCGCCAAVLRLGLLCCCDCCCCSCALSSFTRCGQGRHVLACPELASACLWIRACTAHLAACLAAGAQG